MTPQEREHIENAIRHIQTATDVDPWAVEIAVEAMRKQILQKPKNEPIDTALHKKHCSRCGRQFTEDDYWTADYCRGCGQAIDWEE